MANSNLSKAEQAVRDWLDSLTHYATADWLRCRNDEGRQLYCAMLAQMWGRGEHWWNIRPGEFLPWDGLTKKG